MKKIFSKCNIYIAAFALYNLQGVLYTSGGMLSQILLFALMLTSVYHTVSVNANYKVPVYISALNWLLTVFSIYGLYEFITGSTVLIQESQTEVSKIQYLKSIYMSLLPIYSFYYFAIKKELTQANLKIWTFIFLLVATIGYNRYQKEMIAAFRDSGAQLDEITNNFGYTFLSIIPLAVLFRKYPVLQYFILVYCNAFIIMSVKRGAIILGVLSILIFLVISYLNSKKWYSKLSVIGCAFSFVLLYVFAYNYMLEYSDFFMRRLMATQEGDMSFRDEMYTYFLDHYLYDTSLTQFIFGMGANATIKIGFNYAHNDWLEIATNQGLVGLIVYVFYWRAFYKSCKTEIDFNLRLGLVLLFVIYLSKTFVSMSYGGMNIYSTAMLGLCMFECHKTIKQLP